MSDTDSFEPVDVFPEGDLDLRDGADSCYKCSTCDTNCPVAAVDDDFPGPKFQGPEQWRLKRKSDEAVDPSIMDCSNCMRCDAACPTGVPLSQMHNEARGEYVASQQSRWSRTYWRNKLLANFRTVARVASRVPRFSNFVLSNRLTRFVNARFLGITGEREFPRFAHEPFHTWWQRRGGSEESSRRARQARERRGEVDAEKRVAYFHGCYANFNTPAVAKAMVRVFEHFGYEIVVPRQDCSGTPMFANGMLGDARDAAVTNVSSLSDLVDEGYDVVCSCTSCSMSLRQEYPEVFSLDGIGEVSRHTFEALEYLRINENLREELHTSSDVSPVPDEDGGQGVDGPSGSAEPTAGEEPSESAQEGSERFHGPTEFAYHAPCHARNQGLDRQVVELFRDCEAVDVVDVGDSCSGISGTYGWKAEKYDVSMEIGSEMFEEMRAVRGETGLTECPTCAMQMEHGTGYEISHPLEILETILVDSGDGKPAAEQPQSVSDER